jgi:hypothetical protein
MSGIFLHYEPEPAFRLFAPLGPSSPIFDVGDPIQLTSQQLIDCVLTTDTQLLRGGVVGFAIERAEGTTAGSRASSSANGFGPVENQFRTYIPWEAPGVLYRTRNYWTTAGTQIAKNGTVIGTQRVLSPFTGNIWGVDATAATVTEAGEELAAADGATIFITAVLDNNMLPVNADATQTAGDGWLVFRPTGPAQMRLGGL